MGSSGEGASCAAHCIPFPAISRVRTPAPSDAVNRCSCRPIYVGDGSDESRAKQITGEAKTAMANFFLTSDAFNTGDAIPAKYTCEGENVSPPFTIEGVPDDAASLALIVDDPDAPGKTFVHWVLYGLPPGTTILPEGVDPASDLDGALQGVNDFGDFGYGGPCPPPGDAHRYQFHLYALDRKLDLETGATKKQVTQAMGGHVLAEAELIGTFQRG